MEVDPGKLRSLMREQRDPEPFSGVVHHGGAYTTAPDMAAFWWALMGGKLLSDRMTGALLSPQIATTWEPPYSHYGYGLWLDASRGWSFVEGFDPGVAMRSTCCGEEGWILTVMGNTAHALWPLYAELEETLGL